MLVVDDSDDVRALMTLALRRRGYAVVPAAGAREAIRYLEEHQSPSLIILDLRMPEMDGRAFLQVQDRTDAWRSIPVLVYSAEETSEASLKSRPGTSFVPKTAPLVTMLSEVQRLCGAAQAASPMADTAWGPRE